MLKRLLLNKKYINLLILIAVVVTFTLVLCRAFNPLTDRMFSFHDDTQAGRVLEFSYSLQSGIIPPRVAPHFSNNMTFPVFNFYAPGAYWITSVIRLFGINTVQAVKLSFGLALITCLISTYIFGRRFFSFFPSLTGAVVSASSLWIASEIFVRGNLSEMWFIALFPLGFALLHMLSKRPTPFLFVATVITLSMVFTMHNVLSLVSIVFILIYIFLIPHRKMNIAAILLSLLFASYFLIPAFFELSLTHASELAKNTKYNDHFLCIGQLWNAPFWGFGGSAPGCTNDGMAFKLGKFQILLSTGGVILFFIRKVLKKKEKNNLITLYFLLLTIVVLFLTLYESAFIWNILKPFLSLFQFPWRLLAFILVGIGYVTMYGLEYISAPFKSKVLPIICVLVISISIYLSRNYFNSPFTMSISDYETKYVSEMYLHKKIAYAISEYLPVVANYSSWINYRDSWDATYGEIQTKPAIADLPNSIKTLSFNPFNRKIKVNKSAQVTLNIHYFPFWKIMINNKQMYPAEFDKLGRPVFFISKPSIITAEYDQTFLEKMSNAITVITALILCGILFYKPLWSKISKILK